MRNKTKQWMLAACLIIGSNAATAQTLRGTVTDAATGEALIGATVKATGTEAMAVTNATGEYTLSNLKPGRYDLEVSYMGYDPSIIKEILVAGTKDVLVDVGMKESSSTLGEVIVRPRVNKLEPVNPLSLVGGKMLSMEEASRYAGGFNDPARIVSSFAGIGGTSDNNGISIHGHSPSSLQWRLEGVQIYSPNHFADVLESGAGVIGAINSNIMANSDFYASAYGAEYSNAFSGVFDMRLRQGNSTKYEHYAQVGTMGAEMSSEGPLSTNGRSSYIVNYRYSLTTLANDLGAVDMEGEVVNFQDLNVNLHFPTRNSGTFNIFGIGMYDKSTQEEPNDVTSWESLNDAEKFTTHNALAIIGAKHRMQLPGNWTWQTTAVYNYNLIKADDAYFLFDFDNHQLLNADKALDYDHTKQENQQATLTTSLARQLTPHFYTKLGGTYTHNFYNLSYSKADYIYQPQTIHQLIDASGNTGLANVYVSNSWKPRGSIFALNFGLAANYFLLSKELSVEPRLQAQWKPDTRNTFSAGYGLNSLMEKLDVYFTPDQNGIAGAGQGLGLSKNHQMTIAYSHLFNDNLNLTVEGFYQYGFHIPVSADPNGTFCLVNRIDIVPTEPLAAKGNLRNYGVDATLEHYMKNGFYATLNGSLYDMKYRAQDGIWRDTRLNRGYIVKLLGGKEWMLGNKGKNVLNISAKGTYMGGIHHTPIDIAATEAAYERGQYLYQVIYDESRAMEEQYDPMFVLDLTLSYKITGRKVSHTIAFHGVNLFDAKSPTYDSYNFATHSVKTWQSTASYPNLYYRIDF